MLAQREERAAYDKLHGLVSKLYNCDAVADYAQIEDARVVRADAVAKLKSAEADLLSANEAALSDVKLLGTEVWVLAGTAAE